MPAAWLPSRPWVLLGPLRLRIALFLAGWRRVSFMATVRLNQMMCPRMTGRLEKPQPMTVVKKPCHSLEVVRFTNLQRRLRAVMCVPGTVLGFTDVAKLVLRTPRE